MDDRMTWAQVVGLSSGCLLVPQPVEAQLAGSTATSGGDAMSVASLLAVMLAVTVCAVFVGLCAKWMQLYSRSARPDDGRDRREIPLLVGAAAFSSALVTVAFVFMILRLENAAELARQLVESISTRTTTIELAREVAIEVAVSEARAAAIAETRRILAESREELAGTGSERSNADALVDIIARRYGGVSPEIDLNGALAIEADGDGQRVMLEARATAQLQFTVDSEATYIIETSEADEGWDAYMYLYRLEDGNELERVATDDDGGEEYNARLQLPLVGGTYYVVVEELAGRAGSCTVSVSRVDVEG